jgi:replication fork protection complex subunit Tof1/Swi1
MELWEKSETVDPDVRAYVESLVTALGGRSTYDDSYGIQIQQTFNKNTG